jgi:hypothetical protein
MEEADGEGEVTRSRRRHTNNRNKDNKQNGEYYWEPRKYLIEARVK